tara:strand:- start:1858 stop:2121 length:264 start_codon:yes stop_codon:yes gene_type:complete
MTVKKMTLDDMVYLCLKDGVTWWTYWSLQRVIKNRSGTFYGEPSISAAIRNLRKDKQRARYNLKKYGEVIEKRKIKNGRGYEFKLIG